MRKKYNKSDRMAHYFIIMMQTVWILLLLTKLYNK